MRKLILMMCMTLFSMMTMAGPVDVGVGYVNQVGFASVDVVAMATGGEVADDDVICNNSASGPVKMASCKNGHKVTDNYSAGDASKLFANMQADMRPDIQKAATGSVGEYDLGHMIALVSFQRTALHRHHTLGDGCKNKTGWHSLHVPIV